MTDWYRDEEDLWGPLLAFLTGRSADGPAVVWSAGCCTGEEPYTLAMLTAEWEHPPYILATDTHSGAIMRARDGRYPDVSCRPPWAPESLAKFFTFDGQWATVVEPIRERVQFGRHDLTRGEYPLNVPADVVLLRNVLHMVGPAGLAAALATAGDGVADDGVLVVGKSDLNVPEILAALEEWGRADEHPMIFRKH